LRAHPLLSLLPLVAVACAGPDKASTSGAGVSFERYERAVFAYRDCMEASGYGIDLQRSSRTDELYEYFAPGEAVSDGTDDRCYLTHLDKVDAEWQRDVNRRHPELDEARQSLVRCAEMFGLDVPAAATVDEVYDLIIASGHDVPECLTG